MLPIIFVTVAPRCASVLVRPIATRRVEGPSGRKDPPLPGISSAAGTRRRWRRQLRDGELAVQKRQPDAAVILSALYCLNFVEREGQDPNFKLKKKKKTEDGLTRTDNLEIVISYDARRENWNLTRYRCATPPNTGLL